MLSRITKLYNNNKLYPIIRNFCECDIYTKYFCGGINCNYYNDNKFISNNKYVENDNKYVENDNKYNITELGEFEKQIVNRLKELEKPKISEITKRNIEFEKMKKQKIKERDREHYNYYSDLIADYIYKALAIGLGFFTILGLIFAPDALCPIVLFLAIFC